MILGEVLANSAKNHPKKTALIYQDQRISYQELFQKVQLMASGLKNLGVEKGDGVGLLLPNCPEFVVSYFAIAAIGAVIIPLNIMFKREELNYILGDAQAKVLVTNNTFMELAQGLRQSINSLKEVVIAGDKEDLPGLVAAAQEENLEYLDKGSEEIKPEDVAVYLYTSGTTGHPKGAMLSHNNLISNVCSTIEAIETNSQENYLCILPLFHTLAATICMLVPIYLGTTITIHHSFVPHKVLESLARDGIGVFVGVPSIYMVLANSDLNRNQYDFSKLRVCLCGGASMPVEIIKRFEAKYPGANLVEGYGLSEASPVVCVNPVSGLRKSGTIGLPIPRVTVKIFSEKDEEMPPNEVGEIVVQGPNVMKGYYNLPEASAKALRNDWLHTGDLGKIDEDGYVSIVDRKKDLIIVGGLNVYPREVEEALYTHPAVAEAAVIGFQDQLRGEVVKAIVALKPKEEITERQLIKYCRERLASFKVPRIVEIVEALPKTSSGKILKRVLT